MSARDLGSLVARAARADPSAEAELHDFLAPGLRRHFQRRLREARVGAADDHSIDDLAQRTWIEFFRAVRGGKYDAARAAPSTFLYAISANIWLRHRRESQQLRPVAMPDCVLDAVVAEAEMRPMELAHAIDAVRRIVEGEDLAGAFSDGDRDLLRGIGEGESERHQASRTGVSPSTAHARRTAVLERFRQRLLALGIGVSYRADPPKDAKKE